MAKESLTQEYLKSILKYDSETGFFIWKISLSRAIKVGSLAGSKEKYIRILINKKRYLAHRLAWFYIYGEWPDQIDYINHNPKDNRLINLRNVNAIQNQRNRSANKNNTSGIIGVFWRKRDKRWVAFITLKGIHVHLGYFYNQFDAICARKSAENKHNFHRNHGF